MDTIEAVRTSGNQGLLSKLPSRLHHNAFVVKDHEVKPPVFEDLLGIPLVATWCEKKLQCGTAAGSRVLPHFLCDGRRQARSPSSNSPILSSTR